MIPVSEPIFSGNEEKYVLDCLSSGWVSSSGEYIERFEDEFSNYIGKQFGIAVSSGTAALETALFAIGIKPGNEIIMPAFTIISCALAAVRLGAVPVFTDIELETWNVDVTQIENKITSKTQAIMPVHMYGHPVDMDPILDIAEKNNLIVIEDSAEVHGAEYRGRKCGTFGTASAFSFYGNKIITTGEGGMVLTDDEKVAERARSYRNLCFESDKRFVHRELGNNYRMTNLQAALGCAQLENIEKHVAIKREIGAWYHQRLSKVGGVKFQQEKPWAKMVYWMYCMELDEETGFSAETMQAELGKRGIGTRPFFLGLHLQPVFQKMDWYKKVDLPVTERASRQGLYLPSGLNLTRDKVESVCDAIEDILKII